MTTSKFQQELDRLHAFYQKELGKKDKTISGLHRILDGNDRKIDQLRDQLSAERMLTKWLPKGTDKLLEALNAASDFMDYLRANTGVNDEWPIELKVAPDAIEPINRLLNDFESKVYAITKPKRCLSPK